MGLPDFFALEVSGVGCVLSKMPKLPASFDARRVIDTEVARAVAGDGEKSSQAFCSITAVVLAGHGSVRTDAFVIYVRDPELRKALRYAVLCGFRLLGVVS